MQEQYRPDLIESEVQQFWAENKTFKAVKDPNKEKYYCLFHVPLSIRSFTYGTCAQLYSLAM